MKRSFLTAAIGALMIGAGFGTNALVVPRGLQQRNEREDYGQNPVYRRSRIAGKHNPAGTKLASKAAEGTVGLARLR